MREGLFEKHRLDNVALAIAGGTPQAQGIVGPVPQGYAWYLENVAYWVRGQAHTAAVNFAVTPDDTLLGGGVVTNWDGMGTIVAFGAGNFGNWGDTPYYMGPGHFLHVVAFGGTLAAGDLVTATAQIAVHQLDPHYLMTPEDAVQVKERHERMAAELNMDAVGDRAN